MDNVSEYAQSKTTHIVYQQCYHEACTSEHRFSRTRNRPGRNMAAKDRRQGLLCYSIISGHATEHKVTSKRAVVVTRHLFPTPLRTILLKQYHIRTLLLIVHPDTGREEPSIPDRCQASAVTMDVYCELLATVALVELPHTAANLRVNRDETRRGDQGDWRSRRPCLPGTCCQQGLQASSDMKEP